MCSIIPPRDFTSSLEHKGIVDAIYIWRNSFATHRDDTREGGTHNKSWNAFSVNTNWLLNVLNIIRNLVLNSPLIEEGCGWADVACRCFLLSRACNHGTYRASFHYILYIYIDIIYGIYTRYDITSTAVCEKRDLIDKRGEVEKREGEKETRRKGASEGGRDIVTPLTPDQPPREYTIHVYVLLDPSSTL